MNGGNTFFPMHFFMYIHEERESFLISGFCSIGLILDIINVLFFTGNPCIIKESLHYVNFIDGWSDLNLQIMTGTQNYQGQITIS